MTNEELRKAAERIRGTAKNPRLGLDNWYPAHPGDDAAFTTQQRAYNFDVVTVAEFVLAHLAAAEPDQYTQAETYPAGEDIPY